MIAIKFNNGKIESWKYPCYSLEDLKPNSEGFELYEYSGDRQNILYLKQNNGQLIIDEEAKHKDENKKLIYEQIITLKSELVKIKEDIEQETFGLIRNDYATKKARAAEIVNELRALEGKQPREVEGDIL